MGRSQQRHGAIGKEPELSRLLDPRRSGCRMHRVRPHGRTIADPAQAE